MLLPQEDHIVSHLTSLMCIQCVFQQYHEAPDDAKHFYYLFIYVVIYLFIDLPIYLFLPHLMLFTTWPVFIHKTDSS